MPGGECILWYIALSGNLFFLCMSIIFNIFNTLFTFCSEIYDILTYSAPGGVSINCRASVRNCRRQVLQML